MPRASVNYTHNSCILGASKQNNIICEQLGFDLFKRSVSSVSKFLTITINQIQIEYDHSYLMSSPVANQINFISDH